MIKKKLFKLVIDLIFSIIMFYGLYINIKWYSNVECMYTIKTNSIKIIKEFDFIYKNYNKTSINLGLINDINLNLMMTKVNINEKNYEKYFEYINEEFKLNILKIMSHPLIYTEYNNNYLIHTYTHSNFIKDEILKDNFLISNIDLNNIYRDQYISNNYLILEKNIFDKILENTDITDFSNKIFLDEEMVKMTKNFKVYKHLEIKATKSLLKK